MLLISPDYLEIGMSNQLPATLTGYKIPNSHILYGETKKGRYLFQDIYTPLNRICFVNIFSDKDHVFYLLKHTPTYYIQIQLENSLHCHYANLPDAIMYEWAINLFHAKNQFTEISAKENNNYSLIIIFIPDNFIKKLATVHPVIKKFEQAQENTEHTTKLFSGNAICSFEIIDLINDIKENNVLQQDAINKLTKCALNLLTQKRLTKQSHVETKLVNKIYSLKNYMVENLTTNYHRNDLTKQFKISNYHFDKTFHKIYNLTPLRLIKHYRMSEAVKEIQNNNTELKAIAARYNYNYHSFRRAFFSIKKKMPANYRTLQPDNKNKRQPRK